MKELLSYPLAGPRPSLHPLLQTALIIGVFLVFGVLALRHVGGSGFLADQADQLQFFERFLRLDPNGLRGPVMSGPDPPTRTIGPLGAVLFGLPVQLGFGVDAVQAVTSVLLVLTTLGAFLALARVDLRLAWVWLLLFTANGIVWWNAGMLWANTLMLPAGNVLLICTVLCLRHPTLARLVALLLVAIFAAQVSLVAITALPPIAIVALRTWRPAWRRPPGRAVGIALAAAVVLAIGPYAIAEGMTAFGNTRALITHVTQDKGPEAAPNPARALPVLERAADPAGVMQSAGLTGWTAVVLGMAIAAVSWLLWAVKAGVPPGDTIVWLVAMSVVAIAGQAAFFVLENRELLSYHYISMLVPLYAVPPAALAAWVLARASLPARDVALGLGVACLAILAWRGPGRADAHWERTDWTYTRIVGAVNALCGPGGAARIVEGNGFESLMPGHDGVVTYLMTRRFVPCRHDAASDVMVVASREGGHEPSRQEPDGTYHLVEVADPGIALYRRGADR